MYFFDLFKAWVALLNIYENFGLSFEVKLPCGLHL